ncbi:MAG TPA: dienelactone hydrolase family protein, partial [Polyangiaceae bacterium]
FYGVLSHRHGLYYSPTGLDPKKKPIEPVEAARSLKCPLLAFFGAEDPFIPLEDVRALEANLRGLEHRTEVRVYDGAGHAFMNDTRPAMYRPESASDAFGRMIAFFRRELASTPQA